MSDEETKTEETKEAGEKTTEGEPEHTETEQLAMKIGWNPKHKEGDREYVSADDFIVRSKEIQTTMSKQIKGQNKKIDKLVSGMQNLKTHYQQVAEVNSAQIKQKLTELRAEKREATEDGDDDIVKNVDAQIKELEKTPTAVPEDAEAQEHPDFAPWCEDNPWYDEDEELRQYADTQGTLEKYKGMKYKTMLGKITTDVKKTFPDKFGGEKAVRPSAQTVESPKRTGAGKKKFTFSDLSSDQKGYCKNYADNGIMTRDEYIADLVKIGELK